MNLYGGGKGEARGEYNVTDKMYNQSMRDMKFLQMPKKKGDFHLELEQFQIWPPGIL